MTGKTDQPWDNGRVLYLIRHGQYDSEEGPKRGHLTTTGQQQSRLVGKWLRQFPIERVWSSDLIRAVQTADLVASQLGINLVTQDKHFREVLPAANPADARSLSRAAAKLSLGCRGSKHEVVVCHGNLIRLLICGWLNAPAESFPTMLTFNSGVTRVWVYRGKVRVMAYNEMSHLPKKLQTVT